MEREIFKSVEYVRRKERWAGVFFQDVSRYAGSEDVNVRVLAI
jgi:hypothetical protein